jgi:hypothetical protein
MRYVTLLPILAAWLLVPSGMAAQSPGPARADTVVARSGSQVRVIRRHGDRVEQLARGQFQSRSGDTVRILEPDGLWGRLDTVLVGEGRELQVRVDRTTKVWQGLLIGVVAGAGLGAAIGAVAIEPCKPQGFLDCLYEPTTTGQAAQMGAIVGAFIGAVSGAIIGVANGSDTWATVPGPSGARLTMAPARSGLSAGLRFEF